MTTVDDSQPLIRTLGAVDGANNLMERGKLAPKRESIYPR